MQQNVVSMIQGSLHPAVAWLIIWRTSVLIIWHTRLDSAVEYVGFPLGLTNHQILASCLDNIHRQGFKAVDRKYAFHLSQ